MVPPEGSEELQERHRHIHESAAAVHDRAAAMHEKAAVFSEAHGRPDQAQTQRDRAEHECQLAKESRRVSAERVLPGGQEFRFVFERERAVAERERAVAKREQAADDRVRLVDEHGRNADRLPGTGTDIANELRRSFVPYPWADHNSVAAWAEAWSDADVWCCPRGQVRLIYDRADTDVARRLSEYHIRSAHNRTPGGQCDLADTSFWVTHRARTMDCYIITENTLARVLVMPERDYATFMEPISILSTPSATWWRNQS